MKIKSSKTVKYLVVNGNLYEVPIEIFDELEDIGLTRDIPIFHQKMLDILEVIIKTCPIKLKLEGVYNTCDYW